MKLNKLFMGLLGVLAMTACSSDDIVPEQKPLPVEGESEPRYMSVTIRNSNGGLTRAEGDQTNVTDPKEEGSTGDGTGIYEEGYAYENKVNSLRFYFFGEGGAPIAVSTGNMGRSYYDCLKEDINSDNSSSDMGQTVEKILNAVIVINSTNKNIGNEIKHMAAIANYKDEQNRVIDNRLDANLSLSDFKQLVFTEEVINKANGFLLTSSSYANKEEEVFAVKVEEGYVKETKEEAQQAPVDVYVERVHAKVRVKTVWDENNFLPIIGGENSIKSLTYNGKQYPAIPLYSVKRNLDGSINNDGTKAITYNDEGTEKQIYVIFTGWDIWSTADRSYVIKKIDKGWTDVVGDWWNSSTFHRSYWAQNPEGTLLNNYPHNHATKMVLSSGSYSKKEEDAKQFNSYCLENAADEIGENKSGYKREYNPNEQVTNRTLAYIAGLLVTDENGTAKELKLVEWAAFKGTESDIKTRMFSNIENIYYFLEKGTTITSTEIDKDGNTIITGTSNESWTALRVGDVKFVTGLDSGVANNGSENSPRYRSFLKLNFEKIDDKYDGKIYEKVSEGKYREVQLEDGVASQIAQVNQELIKLGGAKFWENGKTYYYCDIAHLHPNDPKGIQGGIGVVRNHIYEVQINSVFGLGTPVLNPKDDKNEDIWETIIPQKPDNEFYLGARLNILSWRVVNNKVVFDW